MTHVFFITPFSIVHFHRSRFWGELRQLVVSFERGCWRTTSTPRVIKYCRMGQVGFGSGVGLGRAVWMVSASGRPEEDTSLVSGFGCFGVFGGGLLVAGLCSGLGMV